MSITVLCPSRGRPDALLAAAQSMAQTRRHGDTRFLAILDADDAALDGYTHENVLYDWIVVNPPEKGMVAALNHAVTHHERAMGGASILGFIGDDHRFRTDGWDSVIGETLSKSPGYAYGYDGFWHKGEIPTQIFISSLIVKALGYYALPDCHHLFVDNAWKEVAQATGTLHYLPQVYIEHLHPAIGKGQWDEGHVRVNSAEMYGHDGEAFKAWRESDRFTRDVQRVMGVL